MVAVILARRHGAELQGREERARVNRVLHVRDDKKELDTSDSAATKAKGREHKGYITWTVRLVQEAILPRFQQMERGSM